MKSGSRGEQSLGNLDPSQQLALQENHEGTDVAMRNVIHSYEDLCSQENNSALFLL